MPQISITQNGYVFGAQFPLLGDRPKAAIPDVVKRGGAASPDRSFVACVQSRLKPAHVTTNQTRRTRRGLRHNQNADRSGGER